MTSVAISTITSRVGSSPVISRSIHTSTRTTGRPRPTLRSDGSADRDPRGAARPRPAVAGVRPRRRRRRRSLRPRGRDARAGRRPGRRADGHRDRHPRRVRRVRAAPQRPGAAARRHVSSTRPASSTPATATSCGCVLVNTDPNKPYDGPPRRPHRAARHPAGRGVHVHRRRRARRREPRRRVRPHRPFRSRGTTFFGFLSSRSAR